LMFWAVAAQEELLSHKLQHTQPEAMEADVIVTL
jgi:hypothetical protein